MFTLASGESDFYLALAIVVPLCITIIIIGVLVLLDSISNRKRVIFNCTLTHELELEKYKNEMVKASMPVPAPTDAEKIIASFVGRRVELARPRANTPKQLLDNIASNNLCTITGFAFNGNREVQIHCVDVTGCKQWAYLDEVNFI